jgi:hypothetical protein
VKLLASDELRAHVADHGGALYVRPRSSRCCTGALTTLEASTEAPADLAGYRPVTDDGLVVFFRSLSRPDPEELVLTLEGRRRPHPCAYWDGSALVI